MKKVFLTIKIILFTIIVYGQSELIEDLNYPIMAFESEIINYGTITQGADGVREFKFTNAGNEPLIITEAKRSCGCTIPSFPKEPIKPGESSVIKVKYDTKRIGLINKSVTIVSNAKRKQITLRIKGKILAPQNISLNKKNNLIEN
ncbi:MAG: DUF1573 domain-containing protein [Vicingaceae bacterium]|nr:DUF1573 domain-containing protein [Vicingaceae bacterium]